MKRNVVRWTILSLLLSGLFLGCGSEKGTLQFKANGEDFVRQGLISKDGWRVTFDQVYVHLGRLYGYQADPPYDAHSGGSVRAGVTAHLEGSYTVDLAEGEENADPILVGGVAGAPAGHYNAISWEMSRASSGPATGYSLVISGTAEKDGQAIPFTIKVEKEYEYTCGEYVGDERKGFLQAGGTADLEMTFHFDHIFGDADLPMDDDLNLSAPGFEPFTALVQGGVLDIDMAGLEAQLSAEDYQGLLDALSSLGHVGEGHCHSEVR